MPIYDYDCETCGTFETLRPADESSSPARCPDCDSQARRVYSMPSFKSLSEGQRELRRIEERGSEPRISNKPPHEPHRQKRTGRPWQLGH